MLLLKFFPVCVPIFILFNSCTHKEKMQLQKIRTISSAGMCSDIFNQNTQTTNQENNQPSWLDEANPKPVDAYVLKDGFVISNTPGFNRNGFNASDFIITKDFFEAAGLTENIAAEKITVKSYRYYDIEKEYDESYNFEYHINRLSRGGGRDHILPSKNQDRSLTARSTTEKGSGINQYYSASNGQFDVEDFRRNGLQTDEEVTSEMIVIKQLEQAGVPVTAHPQARIAPTPFQRLIGSIDSYGRVVGPLAAQTTRVQSNPRDSFTKVESVPLDKRYKLVAAMLAYNIGHGAINPENMSNGMINDPGHVTMGHPMASGIYRCVVCLGRSGSRYDGTMVGIMDYYFPSQEMYSYDLYFERTERGFLATEFKYNSAIGQGIFSSLQKDFYEITNPATQLNETQSEAFKAALKQVSFKMNHKYLDGEGIKIFTDVAKALLKKPNVPAYLSKDLDEVISIRYLMQLGALKSMYHGTAEQFHIDSLIANTGKLLNTNAINNYYQLINLFSDVYTQAPNKQKISKKLFSEYLPLNVIIQNVRDIKWKDSNSNYDNLVNDLKTVIDKDSKPIAWSPIEWAKTVNKVISENLKP